MDREPHYARQCESVNCCLASQACARRQGARRAACLRVAAVLHGQDRQQALLRERARAPAALLVRAGRLDAGEEALVPEERAPRERGVHVWRQGRVQEALDLGAAARARALDVEVDARRVGKGLEGARELLLLLRQRRGAGFDLQRRTPPSPHRTKRCVAGRCGRTSVLVGVITD